MIESMNKHIDGKPHKSNFKKPTRQAVITEGNPQLGFYFSRDHRKMDTRGYTVYYNGQVVPVDSHKRDHKSSGGTLYNDIKKKGSSFLDWVSKQFTGDDTMCVNCLKHPATRKCERPGCCGVKFCSPKCHDEKYQQYQNELGKRKCKLEGCNKQCFTEITGTVYEFCSRSHAEKYKQWENAQQQQYLIYHHKHQQMQHQYQKKQQQQKSTDAKSCKYAGCKNPCHSEYEFCCKTHADMYNHIQRKQQKGNHQPPWSYNGPIHFYNRDEDYYEFTNFAPYHVTIDFKVWPTTEHYFQAQKFAGTPYEEAIRRMSFPREAFDFSRKPEVSRWCRSDWEQVKEDIMHKALLAKFTQHEWLCRRLLGTANRWLVEHTKNDSYWGDGGDGTGKNRLGNLLMQVRQALRQRKVILLSPPPQPTPVINAKIQQSTPCDNESHEDEPMDTNSPSTSPTEPLMKSPTPRDDMQTSPHKESTGSPTIAGVQNSPTATSIQATTGTWGEAAMMNTASQATNVTESNKNYIGTCV